MQNVGKEPIRKVCKECGIEFLTSDNNTDVCLGCKVFNDMKLPEHTIVNQNVLNIYMSGNYDKQKGVDKTYLMIAEGVALLDRKRTESQLCSRVKLFGEKSNEEIEAYVKNAIASNKYKKNYDALVFIKVNSKSKFLTFGLSYSDRLFEKLKDKDTLFKKNYAISLAINWLYKDNK